MLSGKKNQLPHSQTQDFVAKVCEVLKKLNLIRIWVIFHRDILFGYKEYARLLREYGMGVQAYIHYYPGTGDIYLAAGLLKRRLLKNDCGENYVLFVNGQAAKRVLSLFGLASVKVLSSAQMRKFKRFCFFLFPNQICVSNLHYLSGHEEFPLSMIGFRGTTFFEQYLIYTFKDLDKTDFLFPAFSADEKETNDLFEKHGLLPGKTALLSPYANTSWPHYVDMSAWEELAQELKLRGYTVCTNSFGPQEPAIHGTTAVQISFSELNSFLTRAGLFIGMRSGLCEIISSIPCKKIVIFPKDFYWPETKPEKISVARNIFTMTDLPAARDVHMLEYGENDTKESFVDAVLNVID